jgi:catechol 2,3-dioxygenase-like lactoylglutathione lyase family enzyme
LRIHEVIIEVEDVDAAVGFYTEVVGLRHVRTVTEDGEQMAELDAEGQRVTLLSSQTPASVSRSRPRAHVGASVA